MFNTLLHSLLENQESGIISVTDHRILKEAINNQIDDYATHSSKSAAL